MSRNSKMRNKRRVAKQFSLTNPGPEKTTPHHGKENRQPYVADRRKNTGGQQS
jgi:hypothetical protein